MNDTAHQGPRAKGYAASISTQCWWFEAPHRTVYFWPIKAVPNVAPRFPELVKAMIE